MDVPARFSILTQIDIKELHADFEIFWVVRLEVAEVQSRQLGPIGGHLAQLHMQAMYHTQAL